MFLNAKLGCYSSMGKQQSVALTCALRRRTRCTLSVIVSVSTMTDVTGSGRRILRCERFETSDAIDTTTHGLNCLAVSEVQSRAWDELGVANATKASLVKSLSVKHNNTKRC